MNDIATSRRMVQAHHLVAAAVFVVTLAVYTITLTPSVPFWDSGEFIATSYVLGIPHPPGTPLYVLIGNLFARLPFGTVATNVNWLSAVSSALAILFTFLLTVRFIRRCQGPERTRADEWLAWTGAAAASFFAAFSKTFWDSAIEAEVYALSSWMQVFILYLGLKWWEGLDRGEGDNRLILAIYLCFLSVGIHLGTFLVLPALVLLVAMVNWRSLFNPRNLAYAAVLAVVGLSVHLYLYLRAQANPPINEGDPETWDSLKALLMREQYGSRPMLPRQAPWSFQFGMYFRYFLDQYLLSSKLMFLAWFIPLAVGLFGAIGHFSRDKKTFVVQGATFLITSLGLLVYLNFTDHEVRERDYFYTSSFHFFAIWIGMGLAFLIEWGRERIAAFRAEWVTATACVAAVGLSLMPMTHHWYTHDRRGFYVARDYAYNMLAPLAPNAFVFTNGDNDTFPLWYIQQVEDFRKDVRVINLSLLNTDWYIKQLRDEEPRVPMTVSDADIERVRQFGYLHNPQTGQPEMVNKYMVRNILTANQDQKPAYLAVTVPDHQGLDDRLVLEALVYRIEPGPVLPAEGVVRTTGGWMDIAAIRKNLYEDFRYRGLFDEDGNWLRHPYKDENSRRLSQNYAAAHIQLAYHHRREGEWDQGIAELRRVLRMFPDFGSVDGLLGIFLLESGDSTGALAHLERRSAESNNPDVIYYYGLALGITGQIDTAVSTLMRAARLDPGDPQPYYAAFTILNDSGRTQEAVAVLQQLLQAHPQDQQARFLLESLDTTQRRGTWSGTGNQPLPGPGAPGS